MLRNEKCPVFSSLKANKEKYPTDFFSENVVKSARNEYNLNRGD